MATTKVKKSIWSRLTRLTEDDLLKEGMEIKIEKVRKEPIKKEPAGKEIIREEWLPGIYEGKLNLDIYQRGDYLIAKSTLAGVNPEDLEIIVERDILTIRGERKIQEEIKKSDYFQQECFWGKFSRTIILPSEVKTNEVTAELKNGVLTIVLPKKEEERLEKTVKVKK